MTQSPSRKRTTGPKNDALGYIVDVDRQIAAHFDAPAIPFSEVKHLKYLRRGYVQTIEASQT